MRCYIHLGHGCFKFGNVIGQNEGDYFQWSPSFFNSHSFFNSEPTIMKGTKVQTLGGRAVAGAWLVAWAIMAMGAIINTHAHR